MTESWTLLRVNPQTQSRYVDSVHDHYPHVQIYYPQFRKITRPARKRYPITVTQPVYPGYIFICLDTTTDSFYKVTRLPIRARVVRFNQLIPKIPDRVILELRRLESLDQLVQDRILTNPYAPGTSVRVHTPICDIEGIIVHMLGQTRAIVDTELCRLTVPLARLQVAPRSP
jgi:transcriptional antiterminator RfaH